MTKKGAEAPEKVLNYALRLHPRGRGRSTIFHGLPSGRRIFRPPRVIVILKITVGSFELAMGPPFRHMGLPLPDESGSCKQLECCFTTPKPNPGSPKGFGICARAQHILGFAPFASELDHFSVKTVALTASGGDSWRK